MARTSSEGCRRKIKLRLAVGLDFSATGVLGFTQTVYGFGDEPKKNEREWNHTKSTFSCIGMVETRVPLLPHPKIKNPLGGLNPRPFNSSPLFL